MATPTATPEIETIGDIPEPGAFDRWLAELPRSETPRVLSVPAWQLVAEGRAEAE